MRLPLTLWTLSVLLAAPLLADHDGAGQLDPTFGGGLGFVRTDLGALDRSLAVALQPDGRIVVAGSREESGTFVADFAVARYLPDGTLDPAFGDGGVVLTDLGGFDRANGIALQPDGRIVLAGLTDSDFGLARYLPDGSLDPSFGSGGLVTTDFGASLDEAWLAALLPDGRIVAGGNSNVAGSMDFALARYLTDGSLDAGFGAGGKTVIDPGGSSFGDFVRAIDVEADGSMVVSGIVSGGDLVLVGYFPDGTLDPDFGAGGLAAHAVPGNGDVDGIARLPDGRLVVAGNANLSPPMAPLLLLGRFLPDGGPDPGFGVDGLLFPDLGGVFVTSAMTVLDDGAILVAGSGSGGLSGNGEQDVVLLRFTPEGVLDPDFGDGGVVIADPSGGGGDRTTDLAVQPDGRIVVTAWSPVGFESDLLVARFLGSGSALAIPTLDPVGLAVLAALVAAFGLRRTRRTAA